LFLELKGFFPDIDHNEFVDYLQDKLKEINLEIPLEDGDNERRNTRDEDY
jgi:DNA primase